MERVPPSFNCLCNECDGMAGVGCSVTDVGCGATKTWECYQGESLECPVRVGDPRLLAATKCIDLIGTARNSRHRKPVSKH
ncbi:hypothetical protein E2C01_069586 [Portunus trituberculatus]|uniref:Uncharacterized protein n=1 Tax=Portunus trituberculatus TaxID=210409 RepID=A0A5B7HUY1_PORTR|nr:hypothetical protein [Portunus trituberculatus]